MAKLTFLGAALHSRLIEAVAAPADEKVPQQPSGYRGAAIDSRINLVSAGIKTKGGIPPQFLLTHVEKVKLLKEQMERGKIALAFGMGRPNVKGDPLGINGTLDVAREVPGLRVAGWIDPARTDASHLKQVEEQLERERAKIVAFKIDFHYPADNRFQPYYKLAQKHNVPVIVHTGDTSPFPGSMRFALPIEVDEAASKYEGVNFVMDGFGNPNLVDAAQMARKNDNVFVNLAALSFDEPVVQRIVSEGKLPDAIPGLIISDLIKALTYLDRWDRVIYASGFPGIPMEPYRRFIELVVPPVHQADVFRNNAERLFNVMVHQDGGEARG